MTNRKKDEEKILTPEFLDQLKKAREERGISIDEVAEKTNIKSSYIRAIEEGNLNELPGGIYNRAYIRSVSEFLGIDLKPFEKNVVAADFISDVKVRVNIGKHGSLYPTKGILGVAVALIFVIYALFYGSDSANYWMSTDDSAIDNKDPFKRQESPIQTSRKLVASEQFTITVLAKEPVAIAYSVNEKAKTSNLVKNEAYIFNPDVNSALYVANPNTVEIFVNGIAFKNWTKLPNKNSWYDVRNETIRVAFTAEIEAMEKSSGNNYKQDLKDSLGENSEALKDKGKSETTKEKAVVSEEVKAPNPETANPKTAQPKTAQPKNPVTQNAN